MKILFIFLAVLFLAGCNKKTTIGYYKIKGTNKDTLDFFPKYHLIDYIINWPDENIPSKKPFKNNDKSKKFGSPLEVVQFDFDKSEICQTELHKLDKILCDLKGYSSDNSDIIFAVDGHTCEIGTDDYNYNLGLRRALEVEKYLKARLTAQNIYIKIKSYGEKIPISDIHELNRRVEIHTIQ